MQGSAWIFFLLFAVVLVITYLAIRRQWARPLVIAVCSIAASAVMMALTSLAQGNSVAQALVVGIAIGFVFSGAIMAIAWYFQSNELRARYANQQNSPAEDVSTDETG